MRWTFQPAHLRRPLDPNTEAWFAYLDVDLEAAQAALRAPIADRGWPPNAASDARIASDAQPDGPVVHQAPAGDRLRGAYGRRAAPSE